MLESYLPFIWLIVFGNIENLILASHGVVKGANPLRLALLSLAFVVMWLLIGTVATTVLYQYADLIDFIGAVAIIILGIQSMYDALQYHEDNIYSE